MREPSHGARRPIAMGRTLGGLTAALVAAATLSVTAGCGSSSSSSVATEPPSDRTAVPSRTPGPIHDAVVLPLISMTGAGGQAQPTAAPLNSPADVRAFVRQFHVPSLSDRIRKAVDGVSKPGDHDIVGQVVMVGCDRPPGVVVIVDASGRVELVPKEVASPLEECLAPVTTVAIAVLPRT